MQKKWFLSVAPNVAYKLFQFVWIPCTTSSLLGGISHSQFFFPGNSHAQSSPIHPPFRPTTPKFRERSRRHCRRLREFRSKLYNGHRWLPAKWHHGGEASIWHGDAFCEKEFPIFFPHINLNSQVSCYWLPIPPTPLLLFHDCRPISTESKSHELMFVSLKFCTLPPSTRSQNWKFHRGEISSKQFWSKLPYSNNIKSIVLWCVCFLAILWNLHGYKKFDFLLEKWKKLVTMF